MDNREKINIQQMVDCEKQEPFYPVTHAQAVKIIDEGQVKNLQDILGIVLEFIRNFGNFDFNDILSLGCGAGDAFDGERGCTMWEELYPLSTEVLQNDLKPVTGDAIYRFIQGFQPDGVIEPGNNKAISGDTIYNYIQNFVGGEIAQGNSKFVTGGDIYLYLQNFQPNGSIVSGDTRAVSGDTVWQALSQIEDNFWSTDENYQGSIKQKSTGNSLQLSKNNELAIGQNNVTTNNSVFTVGIGASQNNRQNAIEVTDEIDNSLKIPFNNESVSIQSHMRNEQEDLNHLTDDQLEKLRQLIADKWRASFTFNASNIGGSYYSDNNGIKLSWSIKDSNGNNVPSDRIQISNILYNNTIIAENVGPTSNTSINDYTNFNFGNSGSSNIQFTMRLAVMGEPSNSELNTSKSSSVNIYAPCYIFCSSNNNLQTIPQNATVVKCINKFDGTITIQGSNQYIYIATPQYFNINRPTSSYQPFKDSDSGFEFSLSTDYYQSNVSKNFTLKNKSITTYYNIVRSDQLLDSNIQWHIINK